MAALEAAGVRLGINPGLSPLGFGLAASIGRHMALRWQWPHLPMVMDFGAITETSEVDSAGINLLLLGLCEELGIHSVLTSQESQLDAELRA